MADVALGSSRSFAYLAPSEVADAPTLPVREADLANTPKPRLVDRVREAVRARDYGLRTENASARWIKRYSILHSQRLPTEMAAGGVTAFLTARGVRDKIAASTGCFGQNTVRFGPR